MFTHKGTWMGPHVLVGAVGPGSVDSPSLAVSSFPN